MTETRIAMATISFATSYCGSCGRTIRWGKTKAGKNMPCEVEAHIDDDNCISSQDTHWANCPDARKHKKPKVKP